MEIEKIYVVKTKGWHGTEWRDTFSARTLTDEEACLVEAVLRRKRVEDAYDVVTRHQKALSNKQLEHIADNWPVHER